MLTHDNLVWTTFALHETYKFKEVSLTEATTSSYYLCSNYAITFL